MKSNIPTPQSISLKRIYKREVEITTDIIVLGLQQGESCFNLHNLPYNTSTVIKEVTRLFQQKGWNVQECEHPYDWRENNNTNSYLQITP